MLEYCLTCYVCIKRSFKRFTTILNFHFSHFPSSSSVSSLRTKKSRKKWFFKVFFSSTCRRHTDTEAENRAISVWIFHAGVKQKPSFPPQQRSWRRRRAWMSTRFEEFISTFIIFSQWNLNCFRLCAFQCSKSLRSSRCRWSMSYDFWCLNVVVIAGSAPTSPSSKTLINVLSCCEFPATNSEHSSKEEIELEIRGGEKSSRTKKLFNIERNVIFGLAFISPLVRCLQGCEWLTERRFHASQVSRFSTTATTLRPQHHGRRLCLRSEKVFENHPQL